MGFLFERIADTGSFHLNRRIALDIAVSVFWKDRRPPLEVLELMLMASERRTSLSRMLNVQSRMSKEQTKGSACK